MGHRLLLAWSLTRNVHCNVHALLHLSLKDCLYSSMLGLKDVLYDTSMTRVILKYVAVWKDIFVADSLALTWKYSLFKAGLIWCLICVLLVGVM